MGRWITISMSGMMMPDVNGFERNITVEDRQQGICGNVAGNGVIGDAILLSNYCGYLRTLAEPYHNEVIWKNCEKITTQTVMHRKAQPCGMMHQPAWEPVSATHRMPVGHSIILVF